MTYNTKQTVINVKYNAIDFIAKKIGSQASR